MDKMEQRALMLALIDSLREAGSWCGETHIQKSCYALQSLSDWPTDFDFIIYKHGPFSFDLQEYVSELRADNLLGQVPTDFPYGTSLAVTSSGKKVSALMKNQVEKYTNQLKLVSEKLGKKNVGELEKLATAIYVTKEMNSTAIDERSKQIVTYKKHVSAEDALAAVKEADALSTSFKNLVSKTGAQ